MALTEAEIAKLRSNVNAQNQENALKIITHQAEKIDVILVLCAILNDMTQCKKIKKINKHIESIKGYFEKTRDKMTANKFDQGVMLLKLSKEVIIKDLDEVQDAIEKVKLTDDSMTIWKEFAIWLHGLYQFTAKDVPETEKAKYQKNPKKFDYRTNSPEDEIVYKKTGVTAYHIAMYYFKMADTLEQKMAHMLTSNVVPTVSTSTTTAAVQTAMTAMAPPVTDTVVVSEETGQTVKRRPHSEPGIPLVAIQTQLKEGIDIVTIRMPHDKKRLEALLRFLNVEADVPPAPSALVTHELLKLLKVDNEKDEEIVRAFRDVIVQHALTPQEESKLQPHFSEAIGYIRRYSNTTKYFVFSQTHTTFAKEAADSIENEETVQGKVKLFLELYDQAIAINGHELLAAFRDAIVLLCNRLLGRESKNVINVVTKSFARTVGLTQ